MVFGAIKWLEDQIASGESKIVSGCGSRSVGADPEAGLARILPGGAGVLVSGELRQQPRRVPLVRFVEETLYASFQRPSAEGRQSLRLRSSGPSRRFSRPLPAGPLFLRGGLFATQSRAIAHSDGKPRRLLGYSAPVKYEEGMNLTLAWPPYARYLD